MPDLDLPVWDGVVLRWAEEGLAEAYHAMTVRNLDRLARWERWAETPPTLDGTRAFLAARMRDHRQGRSVPTVLARDGELVGSCGAELNPYLRSATIGYWLDAAYEGRGLATAAARVLIGHLFAAYEVDRVELRTTADNVRSRAVAERLGFTLDGVLRQASLRSSGRVDQCVYTLLRGELAPGETG